MVGETLKSEKGREGKGAKSRDKASIAGGGGGGPSPRDDRYRYTVDIGEKVTDLHLVIEKITFKKESNHKDNGEFVDESAYSHKHQKPHMAENHKACRLADTLFFFFFECCCCRILSCGVRQPPRLPPHSWDRIFNASTFNLAPAFAIDNNLIQT